MPLPGGPSDKYGNRYEGKWTAYCIAQVMAEEADYIHLEPVGDEGDGCEFTLQKGSVTEYHQVKRQHARAGDWSIPELAHNGVLQHAFTKTRGSNTRYCFISTTSTGLLAGLSDDARRAKTVSEFTEQFVKGSKTGAWSDLLREWHNIILEECGADRTAPADELKAFIEGIAYEHLRRIHIRTTDEDTLTEMVDTKLRTLVRTAAATVRSVLCAWAFESIHNQLYADDIWSHVVKLGHSRVDYSKDASVLAKVVELNARYESMIKGIGRGIKVPRQEVDMVMGVLNGAGRKTSALVSGEAGVGKTGVLGLVIEQLRKDCVPHLYIRVDRLEPTDLPQNVAAQLGLPSTPAEVLAGVARGRSCVLVVDQLDAVSLVSGRNPEFFHCVHELIRQSLSFPNMRLLLACRRFDIEKDNRLRELVAESGLAEEINVKPFTVEGVKVVLKELGCGASDYTERQIELLRLPLHLSIFADVLQEPRANTFVFATSVDLFAAYWDMKHRAVRSRVGESPDQWVAVFDSLCDKMTVRQTLFVPEHEVLDEYEPTVRAMESEGVLVLDGGRIGFFHEGLFDYVFARRFRAKGKDLVGYLKEGEQGLFKRAPLRQILLHAHSSDHNEFVCALRSVVLDSTIRFHLRQCAIEVVGKIDYASHALWQLFKEVIGCHDSALTREVWRVLWSTPAWFPFLHEKGLIKEWLASDDPVDWRHALAIIRSQVTRFPEECTDLLSPYVGESERWNSDILHIIWHHVICSHRNCFDLFMRILKEGIFVQENQHDFWMCIYELPKHHPAWAAEAFGQYLRVVIANTKFEDVEWHFIPSNGAGEESILQIAEKAPAAFLEEILPLFIDVVKGTSRDRDGKLAIDRVWYARSYREEPLYIEDSLLLGIEAAFKVLSSTSVEDYTKYLESLLPFGDYDSVNFVVVRALTSAPNEFADRTVEYLLENPQRLESGWVSAGGGDFSHWAARELVAHVAGGCSLYAYERLENNLTSYFPRWEGTKKGQRWRGDWQLLMLSAIPADRLTSKGRARLDEWRRKFPDRTIEQPVVSKVVCVGSPITEASICKMNDAQWLRAIETYSTDESSRRRPNGHLEGGAHQLSGDLESETKRDPMRFAKLLDTFPVDTHPYYYHALLRGLKASCTDKETVFSVLRRLHALPTKPGHRYLCDSVIKFSEDFIPDDILAIVGWCATEADDPKTDELTIHTHGDEKDHSSHDLLTTAINSVRGAAADSIGTLLYDQKARIPFFIPYLKKLAHDPTVIVRCTAAHALLALYKYDEAQAVDLFLELCDVGNDALLATHHVDRFLYYANIRHFKRLRVILRRMLDSTTPLVRETGARLACLAQFTNQDASDLVQECLSGDDAKRKGAAKVAGANLFKPDCYVFAQGALPKLFNDPIKEIRDEAAACFRKAESRDLEKVKPVIRAFLQSAAFSENVDDLIWPIERSTADISDETLLTCEAIILLMESVGVDESHRFYAHVNKVAELVLRSYRQTADNAIRSRCLDIVDRLLAQEVYGISKGLEEFER